MSVRVLYSVHPVTNDVDVSTNLQTYTENVNAMSTFDWVALAFSSFVVALNMVGELKDIELCKAAVHQAGADLSAAWRRSLLLLNFVRRAVFLPSLVTCIVVLVTRKGGDALSVCLNTVAVPAPVNMYCPRPLPLSVCVAQVFKQTQTRSRWSS